MKIAVYYIATNQYIMFFDMFLNGLENFFPNISKKVILITDCDNVNFEEKSSGKIEIVQKHIDHYYWPIPTLFKMFYIEKFFADDCDYHFYCNANMRFTKEFSIDIPFGMCFMKHYLSDRLPLYVINNGNNNNCVIPPSWAKCHISQSEIPSGAKYCQGGFFGGSSEKVVHLLQNINEMIKDDLKHNIIPIWHDETYLNKYLLKFYWNNNIIGDVKIVNIREYAELMDKNDYFDKFKI
jgi:hypothetical protein